MATLNQPAYAPWPVEEQVAIIYTANQGHLDRVSPAEVPNVNEAIRLALREEGTALAAIRDERDLSDASAATIDRVAEGVLADLLPREAAPAVEAPVEEEAPAPAAA